MSNELVRNGRYQIIPEGGGKPVPMTRVTNVAKVLSDTEGLMKWSERMVAIGMARRPDLVATASTLDPVADKSALGDIARFAKRSAGDKVAAELGTAIHAATEAADLGEEVPAEFAERVAEYQRALSANGITIDPAFIEVVLVLTDRLVCGTTDRLVTIGGPEHIVFDLKSGADVAYKQLEHCLQLTAYSRATSIYDPETGKHRPMPKVNQERGIICHLPASGGPCELYWIELRPDLLDLALNVRELRRTKFQTPFDVPEVPNAEPPALEVVRDELQPRRERLLAALRPLKDADKDQFVTVWRRDLGSVPFPNKADEWDTAAIDAVERAFELAWTDDVVPTVAPDATLPEPKAETPAEDHGGLVEPDLLTEAREQIKHLPRGAKGWMMAWQDDAVANGLAWRMGRGPHVSVRSWWTTKAGYWLARLVHGSDADDPQDDARLVLASVLGDATLTPTISVGQCLSSLTVDQASLCCSLAQCAVEGDVRINDQGLLEVAA